MIIWIDACGKLQHRSIFHHVPTTAMSGYSLICNGEEIDIKLWPAARCSTASLPKFHRPHKIKYVALCLICRVWLATGHVWLCVHHDDHDAEYQIGQRSKSTTPIPSMIPPCCGGYCASTLVQCVDDVGQKLVAKMLMLGSGHEVGVCWITSIQFAGSTHYPRLMQLLQVAESEQWTWHMALAFFSMWWPIVLSFHLTCNYSTSNLMIKPHIQQKLSTFTDFTDADFVGHEPTKRVLKNHDVSPHCKSQ